MRGTEKGIHRIVMQGALTVVALLLMVVPSALYGATTYYACDCGPGADAACTPGIDSAAGDSPLAPWQSFARARQAFGTMAPGDSIAFCQGGAFTADGGSWVNNRCQAGAPCTVTSYTPGGGNGNGARPVITTPPGLRTFSFADGGNSDHEEGYVISRLDVRGSAGSIGFFFFNDIDDVLLDDLVVTGHEVGILIQGSNAVNPGSNGLNERITVQNSRIADNAGQGLEGSCNDCSIINNVFDNNGFKGASLYHNLYWDGATNSRGGRIAGNILTRSTMYGGACQGVSLVAHGNHADLTIENNLIQEEVGSAAEPCWGIAADTAFATAEGFTGLVIRGNTVRNVGNTAIGVNACTDCLIEGNIIEQGQAFTTFGINIPDRARGPEDGTLNRVTVRNNTVTIANNAPLQTGLILGGEGTGHIATGNSVTYAGTGTGWSCFRYPLALSAYAAIDRNDCSFSAATSGKWESAAGSLENWQAVSGFDLNSTPGTPGSSNPAMPAISWGGPAAITYGTALSGTQLNASSSVAGTFVYTPPAGTLLPAGNHPLSVTFTPSDTVRYTAVTATVTQVVNKAPAAVALNGLNQTYNGTPRGVSAVTTPAGLTVGVLYNGGSAAPTAAGSYPVVASVTDPNYTGDASGILTIDRATPAITWATPAPVPVGTVLSAAQLNAVASVAGSFVYTPAAGTVVNTAGTQTLSLAFTPTDSANFNSAAASVFLAVAPASLAITTASLPAAIRNVAYSTTLTASGGTAPYTWSLSTGKLPTGLSLTSATGVISGKPAKAGTSSVTVSVRDAVGATVKKALSIKVN